MQDFHKLHVWEKSHAFTLRVYKVSKGFPKEEQYGLTSQLRRAVSSIPVNLAEGSGRGSDKDFQRFIQIAMGSASESEYLILLSTDLGYISHEILHETEKEIQEIKKMLSSLIKKLREGRR